MAQQGLRIRPQSIDSGAQSGNAFIYKIWSCFGAHWQPSWASWGSIRGHLDLKMFKNCRFHNVSENAAFWDCEALDGHLGLILPPLWADLVPTCVQNGPQHWSKKLSTSGPEDDTKNWPNKYSFRAPEMGPKIGPEWGPKVFFCGTTF